MKFINVGFNNIVMLERIVAVVTPGTAPMRRFKDEARKKNKLIDASNGRRTRSAVITDSDHFIVSAVDPATIAQRIESNGEKKG
ncbi:MAG: DUF370 domain-containing protein [Candidatus Omnitrophica bacterium]|nr:DUF370 domain-containing protein [Candidatus Omnitrophota bacterium]